MSPTACAAFQPGAVQTPGRLNLYRLREPCRDRRLRPQRSRRQRPARRRPGHRRRGRRSGATGDPHHRHGRRPARRHAARHRAASPASGRTRWSSRRRSATCAAGPPKSVVGEFQAGLAEAGIDPRDVPVYESETAALASSPRRRRRRPTPAIGNVANGGAVVAIMCHEDREGVEALLAELGARPVDPTRRPARAHAAAAGVAPIAAT